MPKTSAKGKQLLITWSRNDSAFDLC